MSVAASLVKKGCECVPGILVTLDNYEVPTEGLYTLDSPDPLLSSAA